MQSVKRTRLSLPTGSWLAQQRKLFGKTPADVAQAVHAHIATVRALEQNNRVIPPGWYQDLRTLGIHAREPVWPVQLQPYCGADLNDDLRNQVGFQHSRYWLSKQLCVPEHAVNEVIRDNLLVPHSWLLKLAELGANVPGLVRVTLYLNARRGQIAESKFDRHGQLGHDSQPQESIDPEPVARVPFSEEPILADAKEAAQASITAPARREQSSVSVNWTEDGGLHFSVSAPLLDKIPGGLVELLNLMTHSGLLGPRQGPGTRASRT